MKELNVLSFGAGTQSSALLLAYKYKLWNQDLDYIIFSDTGAEKPKVYNHLKIINKEVDNKIKIVKDGNIIKDLEDFLDGNIKRFDSIPFYVLNEDGTKGILPRQCTLRYKVNPVRKELRKSLNVKNLTGQNIIMHLGISVDEISRAKKSTSKNTTFNYPLLKMDHDRTWCIDYVNNKLGYEPPSSECYICSFQSDDKWLDLKRNYPLLWENAVRIDKKLRDYPKIKGKVFMHKSLKPLDQADLQENQLSLFSDFCDGMCGL